MLRKTRVILATLFFTLITLLFLDFTGTIHTWFGWMAKIQFLPALLALNAGVIVALVLLTLLLGRVYCSVICPLGVMQDIISWFSARRKKKKFRFNYSPALTWLRLLMIGVFVGALAAGIGSIVALLAPYSAFGRIANTLLAPLYAWANNGLAYLAERADSYAFYRTDVWMTSLPTLLVAIGTLVLLAILAWRGGRTYCNTVCPVGTVLGLLSKYSLLKPVIDTTKCNGCGLCARSCKASCINAKAHEIDYSRCVACMDCIDTCNRGAISYTRRSKQANKAAENSSAKQQADDTRRSFLTATALLGSTMLFAQERRQVKMKVDGGLAEIEEKKIPQRATAIVPPGAQGIKHFYQHCTACQLCVTACPNDVLRPSSALTRLMQPEMSYERGYCRPECTKCSEVCPAGAISLVDRAGKSSIQIGHAVWIKANCVTQRDGKQCDNCARHCPTGAIQMVPSDPNDKKSIKIPVVDTERCIGCGACEALCPARPFSAMYVEGHERHREI